MGTVIVGSGIHVPDLVVTNHDLSRVMDTSDDWITTRTGVKERRFAPPGVGSSDLAIEAGRRAMADAGLSPSDVDLLVTATMTPDYQAPGIAALVQAGLGLDQVAAFDLRQQCSGFLYALDLADAMLGTGRSQTALVIGAEVHAGFLPWSEMTWAQVTNPESAPLTEEERASNSQYRSWSVLFGDGAGAMVLRRSPDPAHGIIARSLRSDGESFDLILIPGVGSRARPYVSHDQLHSGEHLPVMDGGGLYRRAVKLMPAAAEEVVEAAGVDLDEIDLVIAHQANDRILEGVRRRFGMSPEKVPSNIGSYGNTTAGTLPILFHELKEAGSIRRGALLCFAAFGAGAHYGAILYREPW